MQNIRRCEICGKFISIKDAIDGRKVKWNQSIDYTYDYDFGGHYPEYGAEPSHIKCINKLKKKGDIYD